MLDSQVIVQEKSQRRGVGLRDGKKDNKRRNHYKHILINAVKTEAW